MSTNLPQQCLKNINRLKCDRTHGAGWLTRQALSIVKTAVQKSTVTTIDRLSKNLHAILEALTNVRTDMVSIANYIMQFREELPAMFSQGKTLEEVKSLCINRIEQMIKYSKKSSSLAAQNAAGIIGNRIVVITCSYSSAVCSALKIAHKKNDFKVLVIESLFNKVSYGKLTADSLQQAGIVTQLVPDGQIRWQIARADQVLLGADSISLHGYFINGMPSLELVKIARHRNIPVYLICELSKIDIHGILTGLHEPEPGFDMIPLELVTAIVTDKETLKPEDVYQLRKENIFRDHDDGTL